MCLTACASENRGNLHCTVTLLASNSSLSYFMATSLGSSVPSTCLKDCCEQVMKLSVRLCPQCGWQQRQQEHS